MADRRTDQSCDVWYGKCDCSGGINLDPRARDCRLHRKDVSARPSGEYGGRAQTEDHRLEAVAVVQLLAAIGFAVACHFKVDAPACVVAPHSRRTEPRLAEQIRPKAEQCSQLSGGGAAHHEGPTLDRTAGCVKRVVCCAGSARRVRIAKRLRSGMRDDCRCEHKTGLASSAMVVEDGQPRILARLAHRLYAHEGAVGRSPRTE